MKIINSRYCIITFCLLLVLFGISGCNSSNGYKNITIENQLGSYSLEYPSIYKSEIRDVLDNVIPFSYLTLHGPIVQQEAEVFNHDTGSVETVSGKRGVSVIQITIANHQKALGESYNSSTEIEDLLYGYSKWEHFQLLDRSPFTISGVPGEKIEYLVDRLMPIPKLDGEYMDYYCSVYFDYNGFVWDISAKCNEELKDEVKADFDHIVQSFKIIR